MLMPFGPVSFLYRGRPRHREAWQNVEIRGGEDAPATSVSQKITDSEGLKRRPLEEIRNLGEILTTQQVDGTIIGQDYPRSEEPQGRATGPLRLS